MVTIDYDGVSTKLMIILMIELGIWVISVTNSSYGLIFVKIRAKYGRIFSKNTSEIRAKIRAKFIMLLFCRLFVI